MKHHATRRRFITASALGLAGVGGAFAQETAPAAAPPVPVPKPIPDLDRADVLVVGGGPAGIGAALGAARAGADTLLIEHHGFFGGVAAWMLGMPMNQMRPGGKPRSVVHESVIEKLQAYGDQAVRFNDHQVLCNVEYLKVAVLDVLDAVKCRYLVHCRAVDAVAEGNRITGVAVATKSGLRHVRARVVIDCTGDADVAFFAGAETMKETGRLSPQTLALLLAHPDPAKLDPGGLKEIGGKARAKYPLVPSSWGLGRVAHSHLRYINHAGTRDLGNFDVTDPVQFSQAECQSRRQALQMALAMREFGGPGLAAIELGGTGPQIGVRESRRVKGGYVLTEADALEGRRFEDVVAWRSGYLDIGFVRLSRMKIHQVPFRAILPVALDGLLTAGRCISATHEAASAGKSMGNCVATGHAAGVAAALAVRRRCLPRELKVGEIQDVLRRDGVDLDRGGESQDPRMPT